jgi:hypothetical protein
MISLKPLHNDVAIRDLPHVFRRAQLIVAYAFEYGSIPLTPSKAFKRVFVNWAAEAFLRPFGRFQQRERYPARSIWQPSSHNQFTQGYSWL